MKAKKKKNILNLEKKNRKFQGIKKNAKILKGSENKNKKSFV